MRWRRCIGDKLPKDSKDSKDSKDFKDFRDFNGLLYKYLLTVDDVDTLAWVLYLTALQVVDTFHF